MSYGARNGIVARIAPVRSGEVKPHAKFEVEGSVEMVSALTESVEELDLSEGDEVRKRPASRL